MEFTTKSTAPEKAKTACLIVATFAGRELDSAAKSIDKASKGALLSILERGDLDDKAGSTLLLQALDGIHAERVVVVSLGKKADYSDKAFRDAVQGAAKVVNATRADDITFAVPDTLPGKRDEGWALRTASQLLADSTYRFDQFKSKKESNPKGIKKVQFLSKAKDKVASSALATGQAIAQGMALAKDLGNLPGNICTPTYLADTARHLAEEFKLKLDVLERDDMQELGMHSLLSVAKGSHQPPKLIVLQYKGSKVKDKPVVLVGKGVTFDSGGISLKPGEGMDEMKYDMCGAAAVLGTVRACCELKLPINLVAIIPATENLPGGSASKPGDIVTSMSGQTIEILNTDAEGRLILCDALTYAERFEPACVVDVATLTGACVVALGQGITSGLLANDDELAQELMRHGTETGDRAWQLPLWEEYQDLLKSNFADMANIGGRWGGAITAASFLARFTKQYTWAHLDIAGTAWKQGAEKGATGRPVPLLTQFLISRSQKVADAA